MRTPNTISYQELTGTHAHHLSRTYSEPGAVDIFALFVSRPSWMAEAACRGQDVRAWYPTREDSHKRPEINAKAVCRSCPVIEECREHALTTHPLEYGIWGGLSEKQRKMIRLADPRYQPDQRVHGTLSRYVDGCHCALCKRANAKYRAKSRARSVRNRLRRGAA